MKEAAFDRVELCGFIFAQRFLSPIIFKMLSTFRLLVTYLKPRRQIWRQVVRERRKKEKYVKVLLFLEYECNLEVHHSEGECDGMNLDRKLIP